MSCECMEPDPNEGNPFEPPETPEERNRRVGLMLRENVDRRRAESFPETPESLKETSDS